MDCGVDIEYTNSDDISFCRTDHGMVNSGIYWDCRSSDMLALDDPPVFKGNV